MNRFKIFCEIMFSKNIVIRALKVSLVVGSILNLINQGDAILIFDLSNINLSKLLLTYAVPYSVTTYTAVSLKLEFIIGSKSGVDADLKCKTCNMTTIHIHKDELIPECENCGVKTRWKLKGK